jgi:hypothetical protein
MKGMTFHDPDYGQISALEDPVFLEGVTGIG